MGRPIWTQEAQAREDVAEITWQWERRLADCSLQDLDVMYSEVALEVGCFIDSHPDSINEAEDQARLLTDQLHHLIHKRNHWLVVGMVM